jgi:hypothetical protein
MGLPLVGLNAGVALAQSHAGTWEGTAAMSR